MGSMPMRRVRVPQGVLTLRTSVAVRWGHLTAQKLPPADVQDGDILHHDSCNMMEQQPASLLLISPYADIMANGVRMLSATLRHAGYHVRTLFLYDLSLQPELGYRPDFGMRYSQSVLDQVSELAQGFDLIGISLLTNYFNHAVQLSNHLRQHTDTPIIWGGVHPTVLPEECLQHADMVCIGEAEIPMLEVMQRLTEEKDLHGIDGIWARGDQRPAIGSLVQDLDSLPFMDLNFDDQYVLLPDGKTIGPLTDALFVHYASTRALWDTDDMFFQVISTRGCPYGCSFCINRFTKALYQGKATLRRRSFDNLFREIEQVMHRFPIKLLMISDDSFFACKEEEIESFAARYQQTIGIPFRCLATPNAVTDRKVKALLDAGMCWLEVGVQSCSPDTLTLFRRRWGSVEKVKKAAEVLSPYMTRLEVFFDLIIDNPWEPKEQTAETLRAMVELPRPYKLQLFSLTLFPGTELYDRGIEEGLIRDPGDDIYRKHYLSRDYSYFGLMLSLIYRNFPRWLLRILLCKPMVTLFQRDLMIPLYRSMFGFVRVLKIIKYLLGGRPEVIPDTSKG